MRIESSVTSLTWIPSEAIQGVKYLKASFDLGVTHYDPPPPDAVDDLIALRDSDRFRFANQLKAWVEVEDGKIASYGYSGRGLIGATTLRLGPAGVTVPAVPLPDLQRNPEVRGDSVRFVQTAGGRTGMPTPRRVRRKPYVQFSAPLAWTTLALTIHADGSSEHELIGASKFPRHWIYDNEGELVLKSGLIDFEDWLREAFGKYTPWGDQDSPALVTAVESALERELSTRIMRGGAKPKIKVVDKGEALVKQGDPGHELFLLLDGVLRIEVDGDRIAEVGPGAVLGERAVVEEGYRTSTLVAVTDCLVAAVPGDQIEPSVLKQLAESHRREESQG
ncbi:MAG TPA: cyclic nucleotide-binding domain-containing protein, partial [Actinomycetota bacterium]|nr:cyclic nucleotide-binding domain-containing protein [Actinomycetota bacterium]